MSAPEGTNSQDQPVTARRALLMGGAAGLAAVAGVSLGATGSAEPADAQAQPSIIDWINVVNEGATPDGVILNDVSISASNTLLTAGSSKFSSGDVGKHIGVAGAGSGGNSLVTTIAKFNSGTSVNLTDAAHMTVSGAAAAFGTDNTAAFQNAISQVQTGGVVYFPAGIYIVTGQPSDVTASYVAPIYLRGAGRQATQINYLGSGDCFRMYNSYVPGGGPTSILVWGGGVEDLTIDGTVAANGSTGLHIGDMKRAHVDITIQNFDGGNCIGLYLDNSKWWTENGLFDLELINCTNGVVFDVTGSNSVVFDNNRFHFGIDLLGGQNAVVLKGGAYIYHADIFIHGGIHSLVYNNGSNPSPFAALTITGSGGNNPPTNSYIEKSHLSIMLESGNGTPGQNQSILHPTTILQGAQGNRVNVCTGIMSFRLGPWTNSNIIPAQVPNQFTYFGIVDGDTNLNPAGNDGTAPISPVAAAISPLIYGQGNFSVSSHTATFDAQQGDFFAITLSQNITSIVPNASGQENGNFAGPQRKTFVFTQAPQGTSGAPFTVGGWPSSGTPTPAHPTVVWLSGSAPLMPSAAGAVMVVELVTVDGATWFGSQPGS